MSIEASRTAAAVGGDVEQQLRGVRCGSDVDRRVVHDRAELDMTELAGRCELLGFGESVEATEALPSTHARSDVES